MIYLDSSALVKVAGKEAGSDQLTEVLAGAEGCSSIIAVVEVRRAGQRLGLRLERTVEPILRELDLVWLEDSVIEIAGGLKPITVRALDAIHVATALSLGSAVELFVSYDRRQLKAAHEAALPIASPGV